MRTRLSNHRYKIELWVKPDRGSTKVIDTVTGLRKALVATPGLRDHLQPLVVAIYGRVDQIPWCDRLS